MAYVRRKRETADVTKEPEAVSEPKPAPLAARGTARSNIVREDDVRGAIRSRKRKGGGANDKFHVPLNLVPPGWTYEWKRVSVIGKEDPAYAIEMREQGWTPVPAERHPEFMPDEHKGAIARDGLILMERPEELTREAQEEDRVNALLQVRNKEAQLTGAQLGQFERPQNMKILSKTYDAGFTEGVEIPTT
jgi:hypothetical protein